MWDHYFIYLCSAVLNHLLAIALSIEIMELLLVQGSKNNIKAVGTTFARMDHLNVK
jgi:hypothetical protein